MLTNSHVINAINFSCVAYDEYLYANEHRQIIMFFNTNKFTSQNQNKDR